MYRAGYGTWDEIEEYCNKLQVFRAVVAEYGPWIKQTLAEIMGIPEHHINSTATQHIPEKEIQ